MLRPNPVCCQICPDGSEDCASLYGFMRLLPYYNKDQYFAMVLPHIHFADIFAALSCQKCRVLCQLTSPAGNGSFGR